MGLRQIGEMPDTQGGRGQKGSRKATRNFLGLAASINDSVDDVLNSALCPKVGYRDIFDPAMIYEGVDAFRVDRSEPGVWWQIAANSTTDFDDQDNIDPRTIPARFAWDQDQFERYTVINRQGKYMRTSAGSLYPRKVEDSRWVITVTKNLTSIPQYVLNLNNKLNSSMMVIDGNPFNKETVMCKGLKFGEEVRERFQGQKITYRECSFKLHYRPEGWQSVEVDADFKQLSGKTNLPERNADGSFTFIKGNLKYGLRQERRYIMIGTPPERVSEPWPLDGNGKALPEDYDLDSIKLLKEDVYAVDDLNKLPLR